MPTLRIRRALLIGVFLLVAATGVKFLLNLGTAALRKPGDDPPCVSSSEAQEIGSWAFDVDVEPQTFDYQGEMLTVEEAWVEGSLDTLPYLVWLPRRRELSRAYLCIRLSGWEALDRSRTYFSAGRGGVVGKQRQGGPKVFVVELDARSFESTTLRLARNVEGGRQEHEAPLFNVTRSR